MSISISVSESSTKQLKTLFLIPRAWRATDGTSSSTRFEDAGAHGEDFRSDAAKRPDERERLPSSSSLGVFSRASTVESFSGGRGAGL
jgi:hypothetical protein